MRRRTWALVRMADVIFSQQVSLPSMIYEHDCDTQLPNNIFDDEFHPGMTELPPSRPSTEPTPISYMIAKSRLCNELSNILQVTTDIGKHVPYDEIIRFDAKLRQIMHELPPHLKLTSLEGTHDPVTLILARFNVDILFQKILCVLHRKYVPRARQNARYAHSRRVVMEASVRALEHLATLHRESQPSGRLRGVSWYVKSIATKDFVLPAMLTVLELHHDNLASQAGAQVDHEGAFRWTPEQRGRMLAALEEVSSIWSDMEESSIEAFKASRITRLMLGKIKEQPPTGADGERETMQADFSTRPNLAAQAGMPSGMTPKMATPSAGMPDMGGAINPLATQDNSVFMGMDLGLSPPANFDVDGDAFAGSGAGPASPFSMLGGPNGAAGTVAMPDLTGTFDWVSSRRSLVPCCPPSLHQRVAGG